MALPMKNVIETHTSFLPRYVLSKIAYHKFSTLSNGVPTICEQKTLFAVDSRLSRTPASYKCGSLLDTVSSAFCWLRLALVPVVAY